MRVLLATPGFRGRAHEVVPLLWALRALSGEVLVATGEDQVDAVAAAGLAVHLAEGGLGPTLDWYRPDLVIAEAPLAGLRTLLLPGAPAACPVLAPFPAVLDLTPAEGAVPIRPVPHGGSSLPPAWLAAPSPRPRVVIAGTPDPAAAMTAVAALGASGVLAIDLDHAPDDLRFPDAVRVVAPDVATAALEHAAAVVHAGDPAVAAAALALGVPQVIVGVGGPLGAALLAHGSAVAGEDVKRALSTVLDDPRTRERAQDLAAAAAALPAPREVAAALLGAA